MFALSESNRDINQLQSNRTNHIKIFTLLRNLVLTHNEFI